jgi:lysophospholipase L1-like esterase
MLQTLVSTWQRSRPATTWCSCLLAASLLLACTEDGEDLEPRTRRATWAAAPQDYNEVFPGGAFPPPPALSFSDQSIRQVVRISGGGRGLRVRLSNRFGSEPLTIDGVHVALASGGSSIDVASDHPLEFEGRSAVTIPAGEDVWSDPTSFIVEAGAELALTLYVAAEVPVTTVHSAAQQTAYVTAGDALSAGSFEGAETRTSYYWITGIDVVTTEDGGVIVAFGDSITDGVGSTVDASSRYPDLLARRLRDEGMSGFGVVNEGISGNRVLSDVVGPSGVSRFVRDTTENAGATHVIILLGINDIGFSGFTGDGSLQASDVTGGLSSMIDEARAASLKVYLGTLTPLKGTMPPYYSDASELLRGEVNAWIRSEAPVDGVIDFDLAMQDPSDPLQMVPAFDSGDHLHPNDAGYETMAGAIDLSAF